MIDCIFCKIIAGEIPAHKLAETDRCLAFLDINPIRRGHALAIPKREIDYLFDLPDELLGDLMAFAKRVGRAIETEVPCARIGVAVVGLEVPHAHVHLIPIEGVMDMDFSRRVETSDAELADLAVRIRTHLP
jgi:histidine triad (HIT) family protein